MVDKKRLMNFISYLHQNKDIKNRKKEIHQLKRIVKENEENPLGLCLFSVFSLGSVSDEGHKYSICVQWFGSSIKNLVASDQRGARSLVSGDTLTSAVRFWS